MEHLYHHGIMRLKLVVQIAILIQNNEDPVDADSYPDQNPDSDNDLIDGPDEDLIFDEEDDNDNVIDEHIDDSFLVRVMMMKTIMMPQ